MQQAHVLKQCSPEIASRLFFKLDRRLGPRMFVIQSNPKYGWKGTVTTCLAVTVLVVGCGVFDVIDRVLGKLFVHPKHG